MWPRIIEQWIVANLLNNNMYILAAVCKPRYHETTKSRTETAKHLPKIEESRDRTFRCFFGGGSVSGPLRGGSGA